MDIYWILGQVIISIIAIGLIHYLYQYLQNSLTEPIEYDYKKELQEKYEKIYDTLQIQEKEIPAPIVNEEIEEESPPIVSSMEAELTKFLENKTV